MSQHIPSRSKLRGGRLVAVLMLLAMVVAILAPTGIGAGVNAQGMRDVNNPLQPAQPDKIIRTDGAKPGVYYIDYGSSNLSPNTYPVDGAIRFYGWNVLNPSDNNYNWAELDNWIAARKDNGLGTGIMITTYDGADAGDIRSTPNFVIKQANAVLPATYKKSSSDPNEATQLHYTNYWRNKAYNANFESSPPWNLNGNVAVVNTQPADADPVTTTDLNEYAAAGGYVAMLGGIDNASGYIYHSDERIPAMPPSLSGTRTIYVTVRVGIVTTDPNPNDHLTMEIWDTSNHLLGTAFDVNNLSNGGVTWKDYTFDISAFAAEKSIRVAFKVSNDSANPTTFYVDNVQLRVRHLIPNYWPDTDAQRTYYKAYSKFIAALGARYKNNTDLQFVAIGSGVYGENQPTQSDNYPNNNFDHVVEKYGNLTGPDWVQYVNQLTSDYASAFAGGDGAPARHLFTQYAPVYKSISEKRDITDYAQSVGVGLSANFLPVDWPQSFVNDKNAGNNVGSYDPVRRYWNSVPVTFESYSMDLCNPAMTYWALFTGLDKHVDYLRMDPTLIRNYDGSLTANAPLYQWAQPYLGASAQNAPSVWTVMREHSNPGLANCRSGGVYYNGASTPGSTWPQLGNYNFFMRQDDSITGGKTVPETNNPGFDSRYAWNPYKDEDWRANAGLGNCPTSNSYRTDLYGLDYPCYKTPYNKDLPPLVGQDSTYYSPKNLPQWTGVGKEALYVRRTDQATDNPYMFFKIDDDYMKGDGAKVFKANITVKYFDIGTDKFSVKYDSTTGEKVAGTVTKGGTKAYKTITFNVTDAKFLNRLAGASDFYIDSRDPVTNAKDGDEWIHMVEVERLDQGTEPATDTPTPTVTVTPSVTPSPTPSTGIVEGVAFNDLNGDGKLDPNEPGVPGAGIILEDYFTSAEAYKVLSGADGTFRFTDVEPGQYTLMEKTAPPGYTLSTFNRLFMLGANQTMGGFKFPHTALATSTPTVTPVASATPTATRDAKNNVYLPLLLK